MDTPTARSRRTSPPRKAKGKQDAGGSPARRRERGSTAVYEDMREDILSLKMRPGSALDEVNLARRFGLSRTPIREALLMLSREDLVTFLPSRSAIVTPHTMSNAHEYMDTLMLLSDGVAEAQDGQGHLFGFERIDAMLRQPITAAEVATAAQAFGQQDDISVMRVVRAAKVAERTEAEPALAAG